MRTAEVARATGYSVQQIRDLEQVGAIPPAERSPNGYRIYTPEHVTAARAYRGVADAVGPVEARRMLGELRDATIADAAAAVSALHVGLTRERADALGALAALRSISTEAADDDVMTIAELAAALGVRTSTLRHWEAEDLVRPDRVTSRHARRYPSRAIREARIVAALRAGGTRVPAIRSVMQGLRRFDGIDDVEAVLGEQLERIAARTVALVRAGSDLAAVIESPYR